MAQIDISFLIKNTSHTETESGITILEPYLISGLTPGQSILGDAKRTSGVPVMHQPHATEPGVYVVQRDPKPFLDSKTQAIVEITYKTPSLTPGGGGGGILTWRFRGTLRDRVTNFDYQGKRILVDYTPINADGSSGGLASKTTQVGQIRGAVAIGVLEMWKYYDTSPTSILGLLNRVNADQFQGGAKYTWLCRDIQIEPLGAGIKGAFVFEYDAETHIKTAAYRNIHGYVPKDIADIPIPRTLTMANGWSNALIAGPASFSSLSLPTVIT